MKFGCDAGGIVGKGEVSGEELPSRELREKKKVISEISR